MADARITDIISESGSGDCVLYFTGKSNFRDSVAVRKGYKANRKDSQKPFHYYNIRAYLQGAYEWKLQEGLEADDLLCIDRAKDLENTIICSRDKDLRIHEGWVYSWEIGKQPSFGPFYVEGYGNITLSDNRKEVKGYGLKFFLSQCITGDKVDNYPGLPNSGPVDAFNILSGTSCYEEGLKAVVEAYKGFYGDSWREELLEQGQLAWMVKELDEKGDPIVWGMD